MVGIVRGHVTAFVDQKLSKIVLSEKSQGNLGPEKSEENEENVFVSTTMDRESVFELLLEPVMKETTFMALVCDENMENVSSGLDIMIKCHAKEDETGVRKRKK